VFLTQIKTELGTWQHTVAKHDLAHGIRLVSNRYLTHNVSLWEVQNLIS